MLSTAFVRLILFTCVLLLTLTVNNISAGKIPDHSENTQDTLKELQSFLNGKVWVNMYRKFHGDAYLFANYFLPGTVSMNGKTYNKVTLRYDIYSDELQVPVNRDEILQLNKEMVDSFTISYDNEVYKFVNITDNKSDSLSKSAGYFNSFYEGGASLLIKYKKEILPGIENNSDFEFSQTLQAYLMRDDLINPVSTKKELCSLLKLDESEVNRYLKSQKLRVRKNDPGTFIPVIRFYDTMSR